ncbi:sulfoxide reductase heme-binding subunit YedZ [Dongia mobilis]|uniref:Protein-methionine-sulfoxide reductase heme-binding subunit MsrQ n=1 Tax=Dongia mobilis TaxID=578943 RepID=A0A4R6WLA9_9PROT|nr:ferric reductase-like transmembrane domain-containing protein [Dongia mobilis]TDQ81492.1 sulfoxide reductase heme-binding subunit YedZ [Dongia mobilis]
MYPWLDRSGRVSGLKLSVFLALLLPGAWIAVAWAFATPDPAAGGLIAGAVTSATDAMPVTKALHEIGLWTVRFLILTLAITPLRRLAAWPALVQIRRMVGVAAFAYAAAHFFLYVVQQNYRFGFVASEIVLRFYLALGFVTLLGLSVLALTSTDRAMRRLGGKTWQRLHYLVYPFTALGLWHFFLQSKIDVSEPVLMSGLFIWLMLYRLAYRWNGEKSLALWHLLTLACASGALAMAGEWAWYEAMTTLGGSRVFAANFSLAAGLRPAWWVLIAGLAMALLKLIADHGWGRNRAAARTRAAA